MGTFTPGSGAAATFLQVPAEAACGSSSAWFYDRPDAPTRITLCPHACETVRSDPDAQLEILIGCATCGGLDMDCGTGTPPGLPPVILD